MYKDNNIQEVDSQFWIRGKYSHIIIIFFCKTDAACTQNKTGIRQICSPPGQFKTTTSQFLSSVSPQNLTCCGCSSLKLCYKYTYSGIK